MSLTLEKIFEAKNRIAPYTTRTPLSRLEKLLQKDEKSLLMMLSV